MAKKNNAVGMCLSHDKLAISYIDGKGAVRSVCVDVPGNIANGTEIISKNLYGELIKEALKDNNIKAKEAHYSISGEIAFVRHLTMPRMSHEQVLDNIPFEFRDYISGELSDYIFNYAYLPPVGNETEEKGKISVMAIAVKRKEIDDLRDIMSYASLKLVDAAPEFCAYEKLIARIPDPQDRMKERGFIDIGRNTTRMFIYKNGRYKLMHMIHTGCNRIIQTIADVKNVDIELARTYLYQNYENCVEMDECVNVYRDISVEILKGLNYYEMSDMSSRLSDLVILGMGEAIDPFYELLKERLAMNVKRMGELFPNLDTDKCLGMSGAAVGILL